MKIRHRDRRGNPLQLDLFASEPATSAPIPLPLPYAASVLSRRYRLQPHIARLVATHAGFSMEAVP